MVNAGQLKDFCLSAADGSPADATLAAVKSDLLFEQYREPGYDGPPGEFGFRVEPLDSSLRALNERYTLPIGYTLNNMFITDWSEDTGFQPLDFYDMYAIMYEMKYGTPFPYQVSFSGEEYEIPAQEFENVLKTYLAVDTDMIRERTIYHSNTDSYLYQPRDMGNAEQPYQPVPEVTACEELSDGTLKLTVEAVWIRQFTDRAAVSELVVRTAGNGSFPICVKSRHTDGRRSYRSLAHPKISKYITGNFCRPAARRPRICLNIYSKNSCSCHPWHFLRLR